MNASSPSRAGTSRTTASGSILPAINEPQLAGYSYLPTGTYGSNITAAWSVSSGAGVSVALIDDGFTPSVDAHFNIATSRSFGAAGLGEPSGGFHGTTTSGLIGASGSQGPVGVAQGATIVGLKVDFGAGSSLAEFVNALSYAGPNAAVINNSWGFTGYGSGSAADPAFAGWYAALQTDVAHQRAGLGDVVVFAAGNDRADANDIAVQPFQDDPRVIAVAASTLSGTVASFSDPGAGLLVAADGSNVALPVPGGGYGLGSGTSYSAPTVSGIVALMLAANPRLGWRDVQEILADSAYAPPPSAAGFATNGATDWNGGGMHFSTDLGFGIVDGNVAVQLARAWTEQSTSANLALVTATSARPISVPVNGSGAGQLAETAALRIQHVQVHVDAAYLPAASTELVLVSPDGTRSVLANDVGRVAGQDLTGGLDLSGSTIESNAFWGENAAGIWTLLAYDSAGAMTGQITDWSLTVWGDAWAHDPAPLVYTPEFAALAVAHPAREAVAPVAGAGTTTIDLIALPGASYINLNGGAGMIDGVTVQVAPGLRNLNADGSTGSVAVTTARAGSQITGGDGLTYVYGGGGADTVTAGAGATTVWAQSDSRMAFIAGSGASTVHGGAGETDVTEGGGASQLILQNGASGGLDVLSGFVATLDTVHLIGYAPGAAAAAILTETSDGHGGALLHLADGTRIDFPGIGHVSQSVFV